jgi:transposase
MAFPVPRVVGVDDWAKRKGQAYGSIIVDLERRQILELLPDREANTLSHWLQAHPGTEIICRDRASAYADGASRGEPSAIQVVDRFHLIRNLGEMLQRVFEEHRRDLNSSSVADESPALIVDPSIQVVIQKAQGTSTPVVELPADDRPPREHTRQRQLHYEQVRALRAEGWTLSAIARHLGIRRQTVSTYCHSTTFPDRSRTTKLDPFKAYILQRWNSGFRTGTVLFAEIVQLGYRGQRSVALAYITRLREASGLPARSRMLTPKVAVNDQRANKVTCRQAAFLVLRREPKEDEKLKITAWRAAHPALDEAIGRTLDFADIMRIRGFARSLRRDEHAVRAAVELPWSTGPVEGHINRLKTLKRQMYGRAMLDLLEKRLLHSSA